jgi:hypothetical protein
MGNSPILRANNLTHTSCYNFCTTPEADGGAAGGPFDLFALEYSTICRCTNSYAFTPTTSTNCVLAAGGDSTQAGGGSDSSTVFRRRSVRPLSNCSSLKCSALCKYLLLNQGWYRVSTTALRPSHSQRQGGLSWAHLTHYAHHTHHTHHESAYTNARIQRQILDMRGDQTVSAQASPIPRTTDMQQSGGTGNNGMEKDSGLGAGIDRAIKPLHYTTLLSFTCNCGDHNKLLASRCWLYN